MAEATSNIEFAHKIHEHGHLDSERSWRSAWVEVLEAIVLATVAVATAWSGYQAARWDGVSAKNYSLAAARNVMAQQKATLAGQDRLFDIVTFNGWLFAKISRDQKLVALYEKRFRPEYAVAFAAWQKLDPGGMPSSPPGPIFMPEYVNANAQESERLAALAKDYFAQAIESRETGDQYVKVTVFLATALLLTALSQRFRMLGSRIAVLAVALILLFISSYWMITFPRA